MNRVAVVVQRWHPGIVGGSEALAREYADLLKGAYAVDLLTTTAVDYVTWASTLPAGVTRRGGVNVRRFPVTTGRAGFWWNKLSEAWLEQTREPQRTEDRGQKRHPGASSSVLCPLSSDALPWSVGLQEDWIRQQGPYSEPLLQYLEENWPAYRAVVFATYLYPTTYFGLSAVPRSHALLVPTLHDEPWAYLPAYGLRARSARSLLWLTDAERRLGHVLWGVCPGRVVAMPVDTTPAAPARAREPYLLYCGRIDASKGCGELVEWFLDFLSRHPSSLKLVLTGDDKLGLPRHPRIDYRGFVSRGTKRALMAGATVFVLPSPYESFSLATLEAMAQQTPVLVNGACAVLADHVRDSGAGRAYHGREEFLARLRELLDDTAGRREMGRRGRGYVLARYQPERVRAALVEEIEGAAQSSAAA